MNTLKSEFIKLSNIRDIIKPQGIYEERISSLTESHKIAHLDKNLKEYDYMYYWTDAEESRLKYVSKPEKIYLLENTLFCVREKTLLRLAKLRGITPIEM
jgi:hypothetical protein